MSFLSDCPTFNAFRFDNAMSLLRHGYRICREGGTYADYHNLLADLQKHGCASPAAVLASHDLWHAAVAGFRSGMPEEQAFPYSGQLRPSVDVAT